MREPTLWLRPRTLYRLFKYAVYALLSYNVYLFFVEDYAAAAEVFGDAVDWRNVVEAYSATIDTAAWVILLLLFELETAVIPDEKLRGALKWVLMGIRSVCYFFIVYACYGYWFKWGVVSDAVAFTGGDPCALVGSEFTFVEDLDEYRPIDAAACETLRGQDLLQIAGTRIIGTAAALEAAVKLAIVDVINSTNWIVIVVLLEVEVMLQLRRQLTDRLLAAGKSVKAVLYALLLGCAVYWGVEGDFLDFWDAFLWLVAFVFIELNVFQWHEEEQADLVAAQARHAQG